MRFTVIQYNMTHVELRMEDFVSRLTTFAYVKAQALKVGESITFFKGYVNEITIKRTK